MEKSTIAGTTIIFTSHNDRETALRYIIESCLNRVIEYVNSEKFNVARTVCDEMNGLLEAAFYIGCTENTSIQVTYTTHKITYLINDKEYEIENI